MMGDLLISLFSGFGVYSLILLGVRLIPRLKNSSKLTHFDEYACLLIRFAGVFFFIEFLGETLSSYNNIKHDHESFTAWKSAMSGVNWMGLWLDPILLFLATQLLWIRKARTSKLIRIIIALTLISSLEFFIIHLTSMHRDYLPSSWSVPLLEILTIAAKNIAFFLLISVPIYFIRKTFFHEKSS